MSNRKARVCEELKAALDGIAALPAAPVAAAPSDIIDAVREILPVLNKDWPPGKDRTPLNKLIEAFIKATS